MKSVIRWGIIGTGSIAKKFADGLRFLPDAKLTAIGSRTKESAITFGKRYDIPNCHTCYEDLANDPEVDIVYIATPHPFHNMNSFLCLQSGKAVLCEKPFTINARETQELIAISREKHLFLMEAMWIRFLPLLQQLRKWLDDGMIGEVQMVTSDYGFLPPFNPQSRVFNPALGGGALLDIGIYPLSLTSWLFREQPERIETLVHIGSTGVDERSSSILGYHGGRIAAISCANTTEMSNETWIFGSKGKIRLHAPWWRLMKATIIREGTEKIVELPFMGNGYQYEAAEGMNCMRTGKTESAIMPLDETLAIMETMDRIRGKWGLKYPSEK